MTDELLPSGGGPDPAASRGARGQPGAPAKGTAAKGGKAHRGGKDGNGGKAHRGGKGGKSSESVRESITTSIKASVKEIMKTTGPTDAGAPADPSPTPKVSPAIAPTAGAAPAPAPLAEQESRRLLAGGHHDPHSILGAHPRDGVVTIRALRPLARAVTAVVGQTRVPLEHQSHGVWAGALAGDLVPEYLLEVDWGDGLAVRQDDPYRFLPTLGEIDQHLIVEGRHERLWTVLGAHARSYGSPTATVTGTSFAVWAPNAGGVRVVGSFNDWDGRGHPMRSLGSSGVWEIFIPEVGVGTTYKFEILGADGVLRQKADPLAFHTEAPPATASVVGHSEHAWADGEWMERRAHTAWHAAPMSAYEVHVGSWRQGLSYRQLADELTDYVSANGFTHVEFLPVAEHPFGGSWGYQVSAYYAPSSRFGSPDEFRYLVDRLHQAGIGVIVDWVPAHFPRDEFALARFDGTALYEHADPRRGTQPDWGTLVFDFGRAEVRNFLVANALFWCEEFHVDGLRVDAVASMLYLDYSRKDGEWLPNVYGGRENLDAVAFLQETNATVYKLHPGVVTIAEESTAWPGVTRPTHLGGLGFGFKWNMGWMHDSLDYASRAPVYRGYHHHQMTFSLMYAWSENFVLPLSHDEVVHGKGSLLRKMPGDRWQQLANLRALLAFMWAHPGKQLLFMGGEFGQESEWSHDRSLDWWLLDNPDNQGVLRLVRDLNFVYRDTPALYTQDVEAAGFAWIDANDAAGNTFSFVRWGSDGTCLVCVANFAGLPHEGYRIGLPIAGRWQEIINTDDEAYTGSGVVNGELSVDDGWSWHGQPHSAALRVPPLGTLWLRPVG